MKKIVCFLLFVSMVLVSGSIAGLSQEKKTISYWGMKQAEVRLIEAQEAALVDFEKMHPDIKVKITVFPYHLYRDKLLVAASAGRPPDICVVDHIWNPEWAAARFVIPLDDYIAESRVKSEDYFPGAWDTVVWKGKTWGIPFDVGVWWFTYYNRGMYRKAGLDPDKPPIYWDELKQYAERLTQDTPGDGKIDQWGLAIWGAKGEDTIAEVNPFIWSNGGRIVSKDFSTCLLGEKASVEAMKFFKSLEEVSPPGAVTRNSEDAFKLFTGGKIGMHLYGEWGQDTVAARAPEMEWAMGPLPKPRGGKSIGLFGGWNMVIYEKSKYKDAAWRFVEYWTSKGVNEKVASLTPANQGSADIFLALKRRFPELIFRQLATAHARPIIPAYHELTEVEREMIQYILLGTKPIKKALDDAAEEINKILRR